jgi:ATP-dependent Clp protease ATP-binding subunit ClpA
MEADMTRFRIDLRMALRAAEGEARARGAHRIGTEHLLLGLLAVPGSESERLLGTDLPGARSALDRLDRNALESVGVKVPDTPLLPVPARGRVSMTVGVRNVVVSGHRRAKESGAKDVRATHLLQALIASPRPNPAVDLLGEAGVDLAALRTRLGEAA